MQSEQFLTEISENVTLYHRSKYPMKVGDIIKPKRDEDGKHWLEHVPSEVALELYRQDHYKDKPSRFSCVYSSIIPRSRFVDKGTLYVVKPRGKMLVTNSALIDEIHEDFDRKSQNWFGFDTYERIRQLMKDDPNQLLGALDYYDADRYWKGEGHKRKEDVEIISDEAVIVEIIDETGKRLPTDKVFVVKEDNKLFFKFSAWPPWTPGAQQAEPSPEWVALWHKIVNHIFSKREEPSSFDKWGVSGYLKKGLRIKFVHVQSAVTKGGDEARNPGLIRHQGKYKRLEIAFEMDGKWYESHGKDESFQFSLTALSFMKSYHDQPYDYGKHVAEETVNDVNEMATLSLKDKVPHSGDVPLKDLPIEHAQENVVIFRNDKESFFPAGFTLGYFMDSDQAVEDIKANKIPYLMVPRGTFYSGGSPITDIWKKKFQKPGTEHILGVLEGISNENEIYVDMITVRPGWQRSKIATRLIRQLKEMFPNAKIETSGQTDKGEKFFRSLNEAFDPSKVIVGAVLHDRTIIAKSNISTHEQLFNLFGKNINRDLNYQWRYNKQNKTVYWWESAPQDIKDDVEWYLGRKFGVKVERHEKIGADVDSWKSWDLAHGKIEYDAQGNPIDEASQKEKIVVGIITDDDEVFSSDKVRSHGGLGGHIKGGSLFNPNFGRIQWRYNKDNKTVYWWDVHSLKDKDLVEDHIQNRYGGRVDKHVRLDEYSKDQDLFNKLYNQAHGFIEEAAGGQIIVGVVYNNGNVWSSKNIEGHGQDVVPNWDDVKFSWRYRKPNKTVYWWPCRHPDVVGYTNPSDDDKETVEAYLKKKYGELVAWHKMISFDNPSFRLSHGYELEEVIGDMPPPAHIQTVTKNASAPAVNAQQIQDAYILAATLWGEARGEGETGMTAVMNVIMNRANQDFSKAVGVALKSKQFSFWNDKSNPKEFANKLAEKMRSSKDKHYYEALKIVSNAMKGQLKDITGKATFYFNPKLANPSWARSFEKTTSIGNHVFYKPKQKKVMRELLKEGIKEKAAEDFIRTTIRGTEWEGKVFVAGGYVRDEFMGKDPKDLDLLVNAPEGGIRFAEWITDKLGVKTSGNPVTFPRFGTAKFNLRGVTHNGINIGDMDIEAVMPRKEQYTAGSRKPEVSAGELKDDVERRDFTVNSLLKDLSTGEILDLTGMGKEDIKAGIVRTPLSPDKIFTDDPLRMLRAVRFTMKYDWKLPMFMVRGLKRNASQLQNISQERIRDELDKMMMTGSPDRAVKLLKVTGLLKYVIPEMQKAVGMTQNIHHKHDVFKHTLQVIKGTQPVLVQRLAALFHDIGKVVTRSVTPTGVHFYGHEQEGEKITDEVMRRLKYPVEIINSVKKAVRNHMRLKSAGDEAVNLSDKALRKFRADMGDELENVLAVIHADNVAHADASAMPNQINNIRKRLDSLKTVSAQPKLPINGNDLIEMGVAPGPKFKEILSVVTDAWFENPAITKDQAIEIAKKMI